MAISHVRDVAGFITVAAVLILPVARAVDPQPSGFVPARFKRDETADLSDCYSLAARRAGAEGEIVIRLVVEPDGRVGQHEFPAGIEPWQKATAECVIPRLRYEPATRDGVPISAKVNFRLNFALQGGEPLTLPKLAATEADLEAATRKCYPAGRQEIATARFKVTVNIRGFPSQVMLVESSGDKKLDAAGACIVKKLHFLPARRGQRPVMSTLLMPMTVRPPK